MGLLHRNWRRSSPTWVASQLPGPHTPASAGCTESAGDLGQVRVSPRPNTEHPCVKHPSWPEPAQRWVCLDRKTSMA